MGSVYQPGHLPSLIRVFTVRIKKPCILSYPLSAQRRLWSDWMDAQADLSLCWAYTHFVGFVMLWFKIPDYQQGKLFLGKWMPCIQIKMYQRMFRTVQTICILSWKCSVIRVYIVCHSVCIVWALYSIVKPHSSKFRAITAIFRVSEYFQLVRIKRIWYLSPMWAAKVQVSLRIRAVLPGVQARQNLNCLLIQAVSQEEPSDRKPDPWPLWMAGHAQLKFVMTECSKTQIRLTCHIYTVLAEVWVQYLNSNKW